MKNETSKPVATCFHLKLLFLITMSASNSIPLFAQQSGWYKASLTGEKTWSIKEPGFDENIYLLEGKDSALLIDAGFGMANLRDFIKTLTAKPVIVVNTHFHPDHTGGDYQFPIVRIGAGDLEYARPFLDPKVTAQITSQALHGITVPDSLKFPPEQGGTTQLMPIADGEIFELGDRDVQVSSVPGHSPGSIFLLDRKNKVLYSGDNMQTTWLFFKESLPVSAYKKSLEKLHAMKSEYTSIAPGHGNLEDPSVLTELEECCQQIVSGKCEQKPYHSMIGMDGVSCSYKTVTIAYDPNKVK